MIEEQKLIKKKKKDTIKKKVYTTSVNFDEVIKFVPKGRDIKGNPIYGLSIKGQELTIQELHSLQAENLQFSNSREWQIFQNTLRQAAIDKVFHNDGREICTDAEYKAEEDIGRAMVIVLDIIENIIYTLKIQK